MLETGCHSYVKYDSKTKPNLNKNFSILDFCLEFLTPNISWKTHPIFLNFGFPGCDFRPILDIFTSFYLKNDFEVCEFWKNSKIIFQNGFKYTTLWWYFFVGRPATSCEYRRWNHFVIIET